jgi:isoleucyl-tRNA synthetase
MELANRVGVDAMRFYLLSSPVIRSEDLAFSEKEVLELQRKNIGRLHNVLSMYEMYKDDSVTADTRSPHVLDRWIIARVFETTNAVTEGYTAYELDKATRPLESLIDDISVWYLRRSRERLKSDDETDKKHTLATLRFTLRALALLMAPSMPFYAEYLYQRVKGKDEPESVHLCDWPEGGVVSEDVLATMKRVREIVRFGLEARMKANIKVRQPLRSIQVKGPGVDEAHTALILDELNVKEVILGDGFEGEVLLDTEITSALKKEGLVRELMRAVQEARKEMGLSPKDRIVLTVDGITRDVLIGFEKELSHVVGADEIAVGETTKTLTLDADALAFGITKLR